MALHFATTKASIFAFRAAPALPATRAMTARYLSSQGVIALEKLKGVFEEYRKQNYGQCLPTRFKKEIIKAADENRDGNIPIDGLEKLLLNIGAAGRVSRSEIETIFSEAGEPSNMTIRSENMMKLL
jgi:hypothetical protein